MLKRLDEIMDDLREGKSYKRCSDYAEKFRIQLVDDELVKQLLVEEHQAPYWKDIAKGYDCLNNDEKNNAVWDLVIEDVDVMKPFNNQSFHYDDVVDKLTETLVAVEPIYATLCERKKNNKYITLFARYIKDYETGKIKRQYIGPEWEEWIDKPNNWTIIVYPEKTLKIRSINWKPMLQDFNVKSEYSYLMY